MDHSREERWSLEVCDLLWLIGTHASMRSAVLCKCVVSASCQPWLWRLLVFLGANWFFSCVTLSSLIQFSFPLVS